ncbi:MAG: hypothetical protein ABF743_08135 [Schleiferilactobacillus perolens]|uniref:hypothetical protein n=1 Tax=Schleiferilactobacillus perolens TaxID=100468 RepID=UPI0039EB19B3
MMEDKITISKSELDELIRQGIAKAVRQPTGFTAGTLFTGIAIDYDDIAIINKRHKMPKDEMGVSTAIYSRHQYKNENISRETGPSAHDMHDKLRFLALAVVGESKNSRVARADIPTVREAYSKFRDLFLTLYDMRAAGISKELHCSPNERADRHDSY